MKLVQYIWPLWIGIVFQFSFNGVAAFFLGADGAAADWIFGRKCNWGWCGGPMFLATMWSLIGLLFVVNAVLQWRSA